MQLSSDGKIQEDAYLKISNKLKRVYEKSAQQTNEALVKHKAKSAAHDLSIIKTHRTQIDFFEPSLLVEIIHARISTTGQNLIAWCLELVDLFMTSDRATTPGLEITDDDDRVTRVGISCIGVVFAQIFMILLPLEPVMSHLFEMMKSTRAIDAFMSTAEVFLHVVATQRDVIEHFFEFDKNDVITKADFGWFFRGMAKFGLHDIPDYSYNLALLRFINEILTPKTPRQCAIKKFIRVALANDRDDHGRKEEPDAYARITMASKTGMVVFNVYSNFEQTEEHRAMALRSVFGMAYS